MSFMQPQIVDGDWFLVTDEKCECYTILADEAFTPHGLMLLRNGDDSPIKELIGSKVMECEQKHAFGARMSAPGYLDCTEWQLFDTEAEAIAYLREEYDAENEE